MCIDLISAQLLGRILDKTYEEGCHRADASVIWLVMLSATKLTGTESFPLMQSLTVSHILIQLMPVCGRMTADTHALQLPRSPIMADEEASVATAACAMPHPTTANMKTERKTATALLRRLT